MKAQAYVEAYSDDALEASLCSRDFHEFVRYSWPVLHPATPFVDGWVIGAMCEHIQALIDGEIKKLVINVAIKMSKSMLASVDLAPYVWINEPSTTFLYCSYSSDLASEHSLLCRRLIESDWYQSKWPHVKLTTDQREKMHYDNTEHGSRAAFGMTSVTGHGALFQVCVPGWVKIATDAGQIPIERIVKERLNVRVLGSSGKWQEILSWQDNGMANVIEIETGSASLACTKNHPIFTKEKGFIRARDLLLSSSIGRLDDDFYMQAMRQAIQQKSETCGQEKAWSILLATMFRYLGEGIKQSVFWRREDNYNLRELRGYIYCRPWFEASILLQAMLGPLAYYQPSLAGVPSLWRVVSRSSQASNLFNEMQERDSCTGDEKRWQFKLQTRQVVNAILSWVYAATQTTDNRERLRNLFRMQDSTRQDQYSSHRWRQVGPFGHKLDNALSFLPFEHSSRRIDGSSLARFEKVRSIRLLGSYPVYNLNVTPDHDYFADNILTHNCDDPHDREDWKYPNEIKRSIDSFDSGIYSAVTDPIRARRLVIGQRVTANDLSAHLKAAGDWEFLVIPTEYDPKRSKVTSIGWKDPRKKEYQLACPERWDRAAVNAVKKNLRLYSAHHQQDPTTDEGAIFKRSDWRYYSNQPDEIVGKMDYVVQSWDLTSGGPNPGSSKVAGHVWGKIGSRKFLLDRVLEYMSMPDTLAAIRRMSARWPQARAKIIENKAAGNATIAMLEKEISGILPWPPEGQKQDSKETYALLVQPDHQGHNLFLPDPKICPWVQEFVELMAAFPDGDFDDDCDALTHSILYLDNIPAMNQGPVSAGQATRWLK